MKKIIGILSLVLVTIFSITACGGKDVKKIGILQYIDHVALDSARQGFIDQLKEEGYVDGENIEINYINAQSDQNANAAGAKSLVRSCDIVLGIATQSAQALVSEANLQGSSTKILFTAVTDPEEAELVASVETPGGNVTGTSDLNPVSDQIKLIKTLIPEAKKIGILYTSGEKNSEVQYELAQRVCTEEGLELIARTVTQSSEIQSAAQAIATQVDALYLPTDNLIANAMSIVGNVCNEQGVLTVCGESGMVDTGGCVTLGIDYTELGKQTGIMCKNILEGRETATYSVEYYSKECTIAYNEEMCRALNLLEAVKALG